MEENSNTVHVIARCIASFTASKYYFTVSKYKQGSPKLYAYFALFLELGKIHFAVIFKSVQLQHKSVKQPPI